MTLGIICGVLLGLVVGGLAGLFIGFAYIGATVKSLVEQKAFAGSVIASALKREAGENIHVREAERGQ